MPLLNVALVPSPDQVIVRLTGDADLSTAALLTDALNQAASIGTPHLVVDVGAARFWDSSGLRALTVLTSKLSAAGRSCRIVGAGPATRRLLAGAGLGDRLNLDGPVPGPPVPAGHRPSPRPRRSRVVPVGPVAAAGDAPPQVSTSEPAAAQPRRR